MSLEELVVEKDVEKEKDTEVLASEILSRPPHLTIILKLAHKPLNAKRLVKMRNYHVSTMYFVLKKLRQAGIVETKTPSLDKRKKYYTLTDKGRKILKRIKELITIWLEHEMAISLGTVEELTNIIEKNLKVPAEYVIAVLDADFLRKIIRAR